MNEQIDDRDRRFARSELLNDFRLLGQALASSMNALHRINFDAPWRKEPSEPEAC